MATAKLSGMEIAEQPGFVFEQHKQGDNMKKYLIIACVAAALVGCANNQGGMSDRSIRESGSESYDRSSTNSVNTATNSATSSPTNSTERSSQNSSSQDNTPKN